MLTGSHGIAWSGAKDKLGLRVHGLIVGSPDKKRADPAVLRSLCSHVLPNGKQEVRLSPMPFLAPTGVLGSKGRVQAPKPCGARCVSTFCRTTSMRCICVHVPPTALCGVWINQASGSPGPGWVGSFGVQAEEVSGRPLAANQL